MGERKVKKWGVFSNHYINNLTSDVDIIQQFMPKYFQGVYGSHCSAFAQKVINDFGYQAPPFGSNIPSDYKRLANKQAV